MNCPLPLVCPVIGKSIQVTNIHASLLLLTVLDAREIRSPTKGEWVTYQSKPFICKFQYNFKDHIVLMTITSEQIEGLHDSQILTNNIANKANEFFCNLKSSHAKKKVPFFVTWSRPSALFVMDGLLKNQWINRCVHKLVITAPHVVNTDGKLCKERDMCDSLALEAAYIFSDKIKASFGGHFCEVIEGDMNRSSTIDLNRRASRYTTAFREKIRSKINNGVFFLDMHSFPADYRWSTSKKEEEEEDAVLLVDQPEHAFLLSLFLKVRVLRGKGNDIQDEIHQKCPNCTSVLFECNESLKESAIKIFAENFVRFLTFLHP